MPAQLAEPTPPTKQSLLLDGLRRVEEHSPIWVLPRLVTTLNLHQHLAAARRRLCDSHRAMMKEAGVEVGNCDDGGISVQGDTTIHHHAPWWLPLLFVPLGLACLWWFGHQVAGGAAVPAAATTAANPANWRLGLKVSSTP